MDDEQQSESADDSLEPNNDIFDPDHDEPRLPEDNDPPAAPADDIDRRPVSSEDPQTDSQLDQDELYSEGLGSASGIDDQEIGPDDSLEPIDPEDE